MEEMHTIYSNSFGIGFYWKKEKEIVIEKIQLIFKDTGFYFTVLELKTFLRFIEASFSKNSCCKECNLKRKCDKFLLKTPCVQVDLAVSFDELEAVKDLVVGTLFYINLEEYLQICAN